MSTSHVYSKTVLINVSVGTLSSFDLSIVLSFLKIVGGLDRAGINPKQKSLTRFSESGFGSLEVANLRILFSIKWPLKALNRGPQGYKFEIDWEKLLEIYPFLNHANLCKPRLSVNQKPPKKKKLSPAEQAKVYRKLLNSGKVKNKAAIARKFGVSRAWVTKLLN